MYGKSHACIRMEIAALEFVGLNVVEFSQEFVFKRRMVEASFSMLIMRRSCGLPRIRVQASIKKRVEFERAEHILLTATCTLRLFGYYCAKLNILLLLLFFTARENRCYLIFCVVVRGTKFSVFYYCQVFTLVK